MNKITSYFIGVALNNKLFSDLINALQKYIKENNIESAIRFPNLSSLHITLYYFGKELNPEILPKIKSDLFELNKKENLFPLYIDKFSFFKKEGRDYLCYLHPSEGKKIEEISLRLRQNYIGEITDHDYSKFITHITLFKIKDSDLYQKHHESIIKIINSYLPKIKEQNALQSINLFAASADKPPEYQKII